MQDILRKLGVEAVSAGGFCGEWLGGGYQHEGNIRDGSAAARCEARLPSAGRYEVRLAYTPNANRCSKTQVTIEHAGGTKLILVNEREQPAIDGLWMTLGVYDFAADQPAAVTVSNRESDGYVVIDGVQWLPAK